MAQQNPQRLRNGITHIKANVSLAHYIFRPLFMIPPVEGAFDGPSNHPTTTIHSELNYDQQVYVV